MFNNFKWISDLDAMIDGTFGIEWENADGYRYWETYSTDEEREVALTVYKIEHITHKDEYITAERQIEIDRMETYVKWYYDDPMFLDDYDILKVLNYIANGNTL